MASQNSICCLLSLVRSMLSVGLQNTTLKINQESQPLLLVQYFLGCYKAQFSFCWLITHMVFITLHEDSVTAELIWMHVSLVIFIPQTVQMMGNITMRYSFFIISSVIDGPSGSPYNSIPSHFNPIWWHTVWIHQHFSCHSDSIIFFTLYNMAQNYMNTACRLSASGLPSSCSR